MSCRASTTSAGKMTSSFCSGTILATKGAKAEKEIAEAKQALYHLHAEVVEVHPTSTGRIVAIAKKRAVPRAYPRAVGEPKRKPLS